MLIIVIIIVIYNIYIKCLPIYGIKTKLKKLLKEFSSRENY